MPIVGTPLSPGYEGRYTTEAEVTTFLGSMNIEVHTDTDGDGTSDTEAVQQGIVSAEARVDLHTSGPWTFAATTAGTVAAEVFNQWSYKLAAYEYAAKRGFEGNSENEFKRVQDEAIAEMAMFKADPMAGADGPDEDTDDDVADAGTFKFITINRGTTCTTDEYSSGY